MEEKSPLLDVRGRADGKPPRWINSSATPLHKKTEDSASLWSTIYLMRPYILPERFMSRVCVCCTFMMVICSKICSVVAPLFLARAANLLNDVIIQSDSSDTSTSITTITLVDKADVDTDSRAAILKEVCLYCLLCFLAVFCAECQTLIYMQVKQEANVVLCSRAYAHVLSLSVNWHISQKAGSTLRILERGGKAADELVGFLLLNFCPGETYIH